MHTPTLSPAVTRRDIILPQISRGFNPALKSYAPANFPRMPRVKAITNKATVSVIPSTTI